VRDKIVYHTNFLFGISGVEQTTVETQATMAG